MKSAVEALWVATDLELTKTKELFPVSRHQTVINLRIGDTPDLVMISSPQIYKGPSAMGLSHEDFTTIYNYFDDNQSCRVGQGCIEFNNVNSSIKMYFETTPAIDFGIPNGLKTDPTILSDSTNSLKNLLVSMPRSASSALAGASTNCPFEQELLLHFPCLVKALVHCDVGLFQRTCLRLAGLGVGATPTADDMIHGALITRTYLGATGILDPIYHELPCGLDVKTTTLGFHMLHMGQKGLAAEPVRDLLINIFEGKDLAESAAQVAGIGATSGYDIMIGIYSMLEAVI
ncbi:MAG: DUF2877 domain-containing protein [Firmicutes bacterium]|nr:DUF2877 domain-containing protein [Bacillota bacterium]